MSLSNPIPRGTRQVTPDAVGNGSVATFTVPFKLFDAADLYVATKAVGASGWTKRLLALDYTVALFANSASVTFVTALPVGTVLRLKGLRYGQRLTSVVNGGSVRAVPLENDLDAIVVELQEHRRDLDLVADTIVNADAVAADRAAADAAASLALQAAMDAISVSGVSVPLYASRASAMALTIPVAMIAFSTLGYLAAMDGGKTDWKRVGASPSHNLKFQDASGAWFEGLHFDRINVHQFGGKGDGATDDASAFNAMKSYPYAGTHGTLPGKTYKINSPLDLRLDVVHDYTGALWNLTAQANNAKIWNGFGAQGASVAVTADIASADGGGDTTIAIASTAGLVAGSWIWLGSTAQNWWYADASPTGSGKLGQRLKIRSVDTGSIVVHGRILAPMTAATSYIKPLSGGALRIKGLAAAGNGLTTGLQHAIYGEYVDLIDVEGARLTGFSYSGVYGSRVGYLHMHRCFVGQGMGDGIGYGGLFGEGCAGGDVHDCIFEDLRHPITAGSTDGVNTDVWMRDCIGTGIRESLDFHPATSGGGYIDNDIEFANDALLSGDAVMLQGGSAVVRGNVLRGARGSGLVAQCFIVAPVKIIHAVNDNEITLAPTGKVGTRVGLHVINVGVGNAGLFMTGGGNVLAGGMTYGHYVQAIGSDIGEMSVGMVMRDEASARGLYVTAAAGRKVKGLKNLGTYRIGPAGTEIIYLQGTDADAIETPDLQGVNGSSASLVAHYGLSLENVKAPVLGGENFTVLTPLQYTPLRRVSVTNAVLLPSKERTLILDQTLTIPNIAAGVTDDSLLVTATGATRGDRVWVGPASTNLNLAMSGVIVGAAPGNLKLLMRNYTAGAINPGATALIIRVERIV